MVPIGLKMKWNYSEEEMNQLVFNKWNKISIIFDKIKDLPLESQYRITRSLEDNRVSFLSSGPHLYNEKMLEHLEKCL